MKSLTIYVVTNGLFALIVYSAYLGIESALDAYTVLASIMGCLSLISLAALSLATPDTRYRLITKAAASLSKHPLEIRWVDAAYDLVVIVVMAPIAPWSTFFYFLSMVQIQYTWSLVKNDEVPGKA